jgi:hypothetical protein
MANFGGEYSIRAVLMSRTGNLWREFNPRYRHCYTSAHPPEKLSVEAWERYTLSIYRQN